MAKCECDCSGKKLGVIEEDLGMLSGFTSRAFAGLAHLREAWLIADGENKVAIESAIRSLMYGHSFHENSGIIAQILSHRMDRELAAELCAVAGLLPALASLRARDIR